MGNNMLDDLISRRKYIVENLDPYIVKDEKALAFIIQYHGEQKDGDSRYQNRWQRSRQKTGLVWLMYC